MEEIITEAKSVEQAIAFALKKLNISKEEAIVEVLEEPLGGEFSIGMTKAKVKVRKKSGKSAKSEPEPTKNDDTKEIMNVIRSTIAKLLKFINVEGEIILRQTADDSVMAKLNTSDNGLLIGPYGETLDNFQYILNRIINKNFEKAIHITVDIEEYREKHINKIIKLATDAANKVKKLGKEYKLKPMSSSDRRIVHTTIKKMSGVTSFSVGDEGRRFITIAPSKRSRKQTDRR